MKPIIEIQTRPRPGRRNSYRDWLILRHPISGGVLARRMIGNSLNRTEVAVITKEFTEWGLSWFAENFEHNDHRVQNCDLVLL